MTYDDCGYLCKEHQYKYKALRSAMLGLGRIYRRKEKELLKEIQRLKQKVFDLEKSKVRRENDYKNKLDL